GQASKESSASSGSSGQPAAGAADGSATAAAGKIAPTGASTGQGIGSGLAGLGSLGGAVGAGRATNSSPTSAQVALANQRIEVRNGKNQWQPAVISLGMVGAGIAVLLLADAINGVFIGEGTDSQNPTEFNRWSWLFGVDGMLSWWARFDYQFHTGYHGFTLDSAYLRSPTDRGSPIHADLTGHFVGTTLRWGLVRASASYLGAYGSVLKGIAETLRPVGDKDFVASESQVFSGFEYSIGLQVWQGLLSPYFEYRFTALQPMHPVDTLTGKGVLTEGFLHLPSSGTLVIGNTFNFSGLFASKGPLRRSLIVDISAPISRLGVVTSGLRVSVGYTISWF
ncbi:MAG: hypothetical protein H6Q89_2143, partial [Myxococcaceae bacterium]|nr:hypothetical protein [Myxococcaceae bacterium]